MPITITAITLPKVRPVLHTSPATSYGYPATPPGEYPLTVNNDFVEVFNYDPAFSIGSIIEIQYVIETNATSKFNGSLDIVPAFTVPFLFTPRIEIQRGQNAFFERKFFATDSNNFGDISELSKYQEIHGLSLIYNKFRSYIEDGVVKFEVRIYMTLLEDYNGYIPIAFNNTARKFLADNVSNPELLNNNRIGYNTVYQNDNPNDESARFILFDNYIKRNEDADILENYGYESCRIRLKGRFYENFRKPNDYSGTATPSPVGRSYFSLSRNGMLVNGLSAEENTSVNFTNFNDILQGEYTGDVDARDRFIMIWALNTSPPPPLYANASLSSVISQDVGFMPSAVVNSNNIIRAGNSLNPNQDFNIILPKGDLARDINAQSLFRNNGLLTGTLVSSNNFRIVTTANTEARFAINSLFTTDTQSYVFIAVVYYRKNNLPDTPYESRSFISREYRINSLPDFTPPLAKGYFTDILQRVTDNALVTPQENMRFDMIFKGSPYTLSRSRYSHKFSENLSGVRLRIFSKETLSGVNYEHVYFDANRSIPYPLQGTSPYEISYGNFKVILDYTNDVVKIVSDFRVRYEDHLPNLYTINTATGALTPSPLSNMDWTNKSIYFEVTITINQNTPINFQDIFTKRAILNVHGYDTTNLNIQYFDQNNNNIFSLSQSTERLFVKVTATIDDDDIINYPNDNILKDVFVAGLDEFNYNVNTWNGFDGWQIVTQVPFREDDYIIHADGQFSAATGAGTTAEAEIALFNTQLNNATPNIPVPHIRNITGILNNKKYRFIAIKKKFVNQVVCSECHIQIEKLIFDIILGLNDSRAFDNSLGYYRPNADPSLLTITIGGSNLDLTIVSFWVIIRTRLASLQTNGCVVIEPVERILDQNLAGILASIAVFVNPFNSNERGFTINIVQRPILNPSNGSFLNSVYIAILRSRISGLPAVRANFNTITNEFILPNNMEYINNLNQLFCYDGF